MRLVTILLASVASCRAARESPEYWLLRDQPVHLSSLSSGWQLYRGYQVGPEGPIVGLPAEAFHVLVAEHRGKRELVRGPSSLAGKVHIATAAQALEFVRLFTNSDTFYMFEQEVMEIGPSSAHEPGSLEMPDAEFESRSLHTVRVVASPTGFVVHRCVARETVRGKGTVFAIKERVSANGVYAVERTVLAMDVPIAFPSFW